MFNYIKNKDPKKYMSWAASETAEATSSFIASVCVKGQDLCNALYKNVIYNHFFACLPDISTTS
jgi:hypothetical protein